MPGLYSFQIQLRLPRPPNSPSCKASLSMGELCAASRQGHTAPPPLSLSSHPPGPSLVTLCSCHAGSLPPPHPPLLMSRSLHARGERLAPLPSAPFPPCRLPGLAAPPYPLCCAELDCRPSRPNPSLPVLLPSPLLGPAASFTQARTLACAGRHPFSPLHTPPPTFASRFGEQQVAAPPCPRSPLAMHPPSLLMASTHCTAAPPAAPPPPPQPTQPTLFNARPLRTRLPCQSVFVTVRSRQHP